MCESLKSHKIKFIANFFFFGARDFPLLVCGTREMPAEREVVTSFAFEVFEVDLKFCGQKAEEMEFRRTRRASVRSRFALC